MKVQILIWWIQDQAKIPRFPGMVVLELGVKGPLSVQSAPTFHFQMSNEPSPPPPCLGVCWEGMQTGVRMSIVTRIRHGALEGDIASHGLSLLICKMRKIANRPPRMVGSQWSHICDVAELVPGSEKGLSKTLL